MFSSNQVLKVSGTFEQLKECLEFALKTYGIRSKNLCFQLTQNGKFCIGWLDKEPWQNFQFGFNVDIVVDAIKKFLQEQPKQKSPYDYGDGSTDDGFLMKVIPETFSAAYEGIKEPFFGIVSFEKYTNYYSK